MRRYLITGAAGQLGYELTRQLGDDALPKAREGFDVTRIKEIQEWLPTLRPDMVINCAVYNPNENVNSPTEQHKCWQTNVVATDNLVKTCAKAGIPFLHISTNRVFGQDCLRQEPYQEDDPVGPIGASAASKTAAEHGIFRAAQSATAEDWASGFRYWIVRTANLYERPWRPYHNIAQTILHQHEGRRELGVATDIVSSFTYVPHLAEALVYLIRHQDEIRSGLYHVTNTDPASLYDFAYTMLSATKKDCRLVPTEGRCEPTMPKFSAIDGAKFATTGAPALPCWQEAVQAYAAEWRKAA